MKVRLTDDKFGSYKGSIVEDATKDTDGNANLGEDAYETYGYTWAFKGEFVEVNDAEITAKYTLTIPVQHLIELYEILDTLPEEVLMSAKLTNN